MVSIFTNDDGTKTIKWGDGHSDLYLKSKENEKSVYFNSASSKVYDSLEFKKRKGYILIKKDGKKYIFDMDGVLRKIIAKNKRFIS